MLGAIRAAKQCLECHDGKRGDLLGAFPTASVAKRSELLLAHTVGEQVKMQPHIKTEVYELIVLQWPLPAK